MCVDWYGWQSAEDRHQPSQGPIAWYCNTPTSHPTQRECHPSLPLQDLHRSLQTLFYRTPGWSWTCMVGGAGCQDKYARRQDKNLQASTSVHAALLRAHATFILSFIFVLLLLLGVRTYRNGMIAGKGGEHVRELNGTLLHSTRATQPMRICGVLIKKEVAGIFRKKKDDTIVLFSRGCLLLRY